MVAPFAGAWIEIMDLLTDMICIVSLPSRERGLKFFVIVTPIASRSVAPFAGAWIEICNIIFGYRCTIRRSLRGSVD